jgi:PadR family transcriptional regulator PadR
MDDRRQILTQMRAGTTEMLALAVLKENDSYGYEISEQVQQRSQGFFQLKQGFLYPTLNRMVKEKLLSAYWQKSERGGPRCKYYRLTSLGRQRLEAFLEARREFDHYLNLTLGPAFDLPNPEESSQDAAASQTRLNGQSHLGS